MASFMATKPDVLSVSSPQPQYTHLPWISARILGFSCDERRAQGG